MAAISSTAFSARATASWYSSAIASIQSPTLSFAQQRHTLARHAAINASSED